MNLIQGMETLALTIVHRLREIFGYRVIYQ